MRRIRLASHLTIDELEARSQRAHEPTERSCWQILWLLARGQTAKAVAESTGYSRYGIGQTAKRYNTEGPAGMVNRQHISLITMWSQRHVCASCQRAYTARPCSPPLASSGLQTLQEDPRLAE